LQFSSGFRHHPGYGSVPDDQVGCGAASSVDSHNATVSTHFPLAEFFGLFSFANEFV